MHGGKLTSKQGFFNELSRYMRTKIMVFDESKEMQRAQRNKHKKKCSKQIVNMIV